MKIIETSIPELFYISDIAVIHDERGSFRTAFRSDMRAPQFDQFVNRQWNISENKQGATRGIHAEPWDKYVHVMVGRIFVAIVDLRVGTPAFGQVETFELNMENALLIPRGCGNSFQALEFTVYGYLITQLWSADEKYPAISLDDPNLAIQWPIKDPDRIISAKDRELKTLREVYGAVSL